MIRSGLAQQHSTTTTVNRVITNDCFINLKQPDNECEPCNKVKELGNKATLWFSVGNYVRPKRIIIADVQYCYVKFFHLYCNL